MSSSPGIRVSKPSNSILLTKSGPRVRTYGDVRSDSLPFSGTEIFYFICLIIYLFLSPYYECLFFLFDINIHRCIYIQYRYYYSFSSIYVLLVSCSKIRTFKFCPFRSDSAILLWLPIIAYSSRYSPQRIRNLKLYPPLMSIQNIFNTFIIHVHTFWPIKIITEDMS